jgi:3-dehydroquinate synthetase
VKKLYNLRNSTTEIIFANTTKEVLLEDHDSVFIIDANVYELYPKLLSDKVETNKIYKYHASEQTKNLASLTKIYDFLYEREVGRNTILYAIGGGITTDMAAFAASTFKRGVRLRLVPTTLLAMVDAALGGKTGLNYGGCKNMIGSFFPAEQIIIDTNFLRTLSEENMQAGMVEIVKMSFLPLSNLDEVLDKKDNRKLIETAIQTKMEICSQDLHDSGIRRLLNLGHTFAHILESVSDYRLAHGFAVAIGLRAAAIFSNKKQFITDEQCNRIWNKLDKFQLPKFYPKNYEEKIKKVGESILNHDKKRKAETILILFHNNCEPFVYNTNQNSDIIATLLELADD